MRPVAPDPALAKISAASVSRVLRRAGYLPVPDDPARDGLKVTRGRDTQHVSLNIDLPGTPGKSTRWMNDVTEVLAAAGYTVDWHNTELFLGTVTRPAVARTPVDAGPTPAQAPPTPCDNTTGVNVYDDTGARRTGCPTCGRTWDTREAKTGSLPYHTVPASASGATR